MHCTNNQPDNPYFLKRWYFYLNVSSHPSCVGTVLQQSCNIWISCLEPCSHMQCNSDFNWRICMCLSFLPWISLCRLPTDCTQAMCLNTAWQQDLFYLERWSFLRLLAEWSSRSRGRARLSVVYDQIANENATCLPHPFPSCRSNCPSISHICEHFRHIHPPAVCGMCEQTDWSDSLEILWITKGLGQFSMDYYCDYYNRGFCFVLAIEYLVILER